MGSFIICTQIVFDKQTTCRSLAASDVAKVLAYSYSCLSVLVPARDGVQKIVAALNQIEKWASIPSVTRALDLEMTEAVIESEEILFEERN